MRTPSDNAMGPVAPGMIESIANVVAVEGSVAWLESERAGSCGACTTSDTCGVKGMGANRTAVARFPLASHPGLQVGDRVVVGVRENVLIQASMTIYALPLATMFAAGFLAQWLYGSDGVTMAAAAAGLGLGFVIGHLRARHVSVRGNMAPQFLRRAGLG